MKITDLKPGQQVQISKKPYIYEGVKKIPGKIGKVQKIVFQGDGEQVLYELRDCSKSIEDENILIVFPLL
jgi:hypothetical protein